jgi:hypothetical protein
MHNKIYHISIDRRQHSFVLHVRSFRAADYVTAQYLVVAKIMEGLAVSKQITYIFHMKWLILKKLNEVEGKEQYRAEL